MKLKKKSFYENTRSAVSDLPCVKDPLIVRKTYDVRTSFFRRSEKEPPMELTFCGTDEYTLFHAVCAAALIGAGISLVCAVKRMHTAAACRRYYRQKFRERCKAEDAEIAEKLRRTSASGKDAAGACRTCAE